MASPSEQGNLTAIEPRWSFGRECSGVERECQREWCDRYESIKKLGVKPPGALLPAAHPDTSVGTPLRAPAAGCSPACATGDVRRAWSIASAVVCRSACC